MFFHHSFFQIFTVIDNLPCLPILALRSVFSFTSLVEESHNLSLVVHPYTFRKDSLEEFDSFQQMIDVVIHKAGADGGFTDFPDRMKKILETKL